jgi:hypothetical protein
MLRYRTFVKSPPAAGGVGAIFADETQHPVRIKTQHQPNIVPGKVAAVFGISREPVVIRKHVLAALLNDFGIDTNIIGITFLLTQHL